MSCPLCSSKEIEFKYYQEQFCRNFYSCLNCELHFADAKSLLVINEEKSRYDNHQNSVRDEGYVKFLSRLVDPVLSLVTDMTSKGLDFGSGPYPMLQELVSERGYDIDIYDPIYANNQKVFSSKYDFITCCEVVEHFHKPWHSFNKLVSMLNDGAILGVMTSVLYPEIKFENWHYIKDDTHVSLYRPKTLHWIANNWSLEIIYFDKNVVIFQSLRKMKG